MASAFSVPFFYAPMEIRGMRFMGMLSGFSFAELSGARHCIKGFFCVFLKGGFSFFWKHIQFTVIFVGSLIGVF